METTTVYWGYMGILEKKMETTIVYSSKEILKLDHSEVLRGGRQMIDQMREQMSTALTKSQHILHVQKHDSIGCALVTLTSPEVTATSTTILFC